MPTAITDWDDAYANGIHIPGGDAWPARWEIAASVFRAGLTSTGRMQLGRPYGPHSRQTLDLFWPEGRPRGLAVYIHGGYWLGGTPQMYSHVAQGPLAHGFAVALPSYRLCPEVRITQIGEDIAHAIAHAAKLVDGPIHLTGHSAGGHLATRMVSANSPLRGAVAARIANIVSIAGLHDLRPLMNTAMNENLQLTQAEARAESPSLLAPLKGTRLTCWVGENERPEFRRQAALLANVWTGLGVTTHAFEESGRHHFDVIEGLADPAHALTNALLFDRLS